MLKLALVGAAGRMGRAIARLAADADDLEVIGALVRKGSAAEGEAVPGFPDRLFSSDINEALSEADVVLDFSTPASTADVAAYCAERRIALLVGTTGLGQDGIDALRARAADIPLLLAPNTSFGVNLLLDLVRRAAGSLGDDYDIEIIEAHHGQKVDAPSGTALRLGEVAAAARGVSLPEDGVFGREGQTGARERGSIGFSVIRGGDIAGEHTVLLAGQGERIELTHRASSRDTFARGALNAARWLRGRPAGFYDMRDVLGG
ncbi:4-hydroxy-tetrahydrodipicolinate reductase [Natronospira bacteriovora]|uniref:4-hydroxy-tetrahydrodipicolinate reductase n=1 Tax=Natronospira bacteriovora TaxID=3069753 RepID=A0ABU0W5T0_9GAMM|nr:4-hydroxy-tetrahydrodipicolinate reductase [Natronospira sp. AB-CW4]MDQ2069118.1 4-hydroxy-tetrahydrodipicolinate reductase [Natronospira sp. AB-CW4]